MLTRTKKEQVVKDLETKLKEASAIFFTNYRGLKVKDINDLRTRLKKAGAKLEVVRKTLLGRAFGQFQVGKETIDALPGQVAITLTKDDPIGIAKLLAAFKKEHEQLEITGGFLSGRLLEAHEAVEFSKLPGFTELRTQFVGLLAAPLMGLVRSLNWPAQALVQTLTAIKK